MAKIVSTLSCLPAVSYQSVSMSQILIVFCFNLACDVIGDPKVNKIRFP